MKVIFLDIDGVLVNFDSMKLPRLRLDGQDFSTHRFYQPAVVALNRIVRETGAKIVISSSWRGGRDSISKLKRILDANGVVGEIVGVTPCYDKKGGQLWTAVERHEEIQGYLDSHPEVESFVIIDDDFDMGPLVNRLVETDFEKGLTEYDATRAISFLTEVAQCQ